MSAYRERDVLKQDVEARRPPRKAVPHQPRHHLSLRNQLAGIELRNHALQHLINDRRQHPVVVVRPQRPVYLRQRLHVRPRQDTACNVDHLQVLGARQGRHVPRFGAHVVDDRRLEPGEHQVCSCPMPVSPCRPMPAYDLPLPAGPKLTFAVDLFAHAADPSVLDSPVAAVDVEQRVL